jgi:membrane protease YdiL (CAAX protease family)
MSAEHVPPRPDALPPHRPPTPPPEGASERPRATWSVWEALGVYLLALLIGAVATLPVLRLIDDEDLATIVASAVAALVIIGVLLAWLSASHRGWLRIMGLPRPGRWWVEIRDSVLFGLVLYPAMTIVVGVLLGLLLQAITGEQPEAPEQVPGGLSAVGIAVTAVYAIVIAPVHEELFFRGILFRSVRDRRGLVAGLLVSGLAFGLIHYLEGPWQDTALLIGVMFFNGMLIAWWYDRRATIVAPLVAHMVFNVIGLSLILWAS